MLDAQTTPNNVENNTPKMESSLSEKKMKPELTSFISLFLLGLVSVLGVLLVNEKRMGVKEAPVAGNEEVKVAMKYEIPKAKVISEVIELPKPDLTGNMSLEESIQNRRSKRFYSDEQVTLEELSQILWSGQGLTNDAGYRAAPSAKSAYPFSLYVVVRNVEDLDDGLYLYDPKEHTLGDLGMANAAERMVEAGVQANAQDAPVVIALVAAPAKMLEKFPDADPMPNIYLEGGHIGQNMYLQTESLEMATVVTGGFDKVAVAKSLELDADNEVIVYLVPFGHIGEAPAEAEAH